MARLLEDLESLRQQNTLQPFFAGIEEFTAQHLKPVSDWDEDSFEKATGKSIADPIVGYVRLRPWEAAIVDTRLFQRLRGISQLGLAKYVYPTLGYSRFEHTLGVLARAMEMANRLEYVHTIAQWENPTVLKVLKEFQIPLRIAALFHDVGHCLFSHVSERVLWTLPGESNYPSAELIVSTFQSAFQRHKPIAPAELLSISILMSEAVRDFVNRLAIPDRTKQRVANWVSQACYFIAGMPIPERPDTVFISQIVSGGLDADKLDYMAREAYFSNIPLSVDVKRIIDKIRVFECSSVTLPKGLKHLKSRYPEGTLVLGISRGGQFAFEEFCLARVSLYDKIYLHQKIRAAEAQACYYLSQMMQIAPEFCQLHRWLYLTETGLSLPETIIPGQAEPDLFKTRHFSFNDIRFSQLRDRSLIRRAFAFGPKNSLSDPESVVTNDELPSIKLFNELTNTKDVFQNRLIEEVNNVLRFLDQDSITSIEASEIILDLPEYQRVQQGQDAIFLEKPARLPLRWTLPIDQVVNCYKNNRALGYVFAPLRVCAATLLAAERVIWDAKRLQYDQEETVSARIVAEADKLRKILAERAYYDGARQLKPVSKYLRTMAAQELIFRIVKSLEHFEPRRGDRVSASSITAFIMQFPEHIQEAALFLCSHITVMDPLDVGRRIVSVSGSLAHQHRKVAVVPLGGMMDSAARIGYEWKNPSDPELLPIAPLLTHLSDDVVRTNECIVIYDDNINSGSQALNILAEWLDVALPDELRLNEHHVQPLSKTQRDRFCQLPLHFVFGLGREDSASQLSDQIYLLGIDPSQIHVHLCNTLFIEERLLSGARSTFHHAHKGALREFLVEVGSELMADRSTGVKNPARALGDSETEAAIVFPYNCPTMTITALWCRGQFRGQEWIPLVERRRNRGPNGEFVGEDA